MPSLGPVLLRQALRQDNLEISQRIFDSFNLKLAEMKRCDGFYLPLSTFQIFLKCMQLKFGECYYKENSSLFGWVSKVTIVSSEKVMARYDVMKKLGLA